MNNAYVFTLVLVTFLVGLTRADNGSTEQKVACANRVFHGSRESGGKNHPVPIVQAEHADRIVIPGKKQLSDEAASFRKYANQKTKEAVLYGSLAVGSAGLLAVGKLYTAASFPYVAYGGLAALWASLFYFVYKEKIGDAEASLLCLLALLPTAAVIYWPFLMGGIVLVSFVVNGLMASIGAAGEAHADSVIAKNLQKEADAK